MQIRRFIFAGGPGSGKSTTLNVLGTRGYAIADDNARSIIRERKSQGLSPRPDAVSFARDILARDIAAYTHCTGTTFFERGVPDTLGSLLGTGDVTEAAIKPLLDEYPYEQVFLFPPWQEIYTTDEERDQTWDEAVIVFEKTLDWYVRCGYTPIEVPKTSPVERADFVLSHAGL